MVGERLIVNLSDSTWLREKIPEKWVLMHGGGSGLALQAFLREPGVSRQTHVAVAPGLLAGTNAPAGHWASAVFCNPSRGEVAASYFGGDWGCSLRMAGIGLLEIEAQAPHLTALVIEDDRIQFMDARALEGLSPMDTCHRLETMLGNGYCIASIGKAGEKGFPLASLVFDGIYQRKSAGLGAQLGAMRLKALAVKGTGKVIPASPLIFYREALGLRNRVTQGSGSFPLREFSSYGSACFLRTLFEQALLPVNNFTTSLFPKLDMLTGESFADSFDRYRIACSGCPIGCRSMININETWMEGPGLEEIIALGTLCGISNPEAVLQIKASCDDLGIDPLTFGGLVASVMEGTGGVQQAGSLVFGEHKKVLEMLQGEELDAIFGGMGLASAFIEGDAHVRSSWVGSLKTDPRADLHLALNRLSWPLEEPHPLSSVAFLSRLGVYEGLGDQMGVARAVATYEDFSIGLQCLGFCPWTALIFATGDLDSLLKAALGDEFPYETTATLGRVAVELLRPEFAYLQSKSPLSERFGKLAREPIPDGPNKGQVLDLAGPWQAYLRLRSRVPVKKGVKRAE